MLLYNITISLDNEICEECILWLKTDIIPLIMQTGYFTSFQMWKLLLAEEQENTTYALQFQCENPALLNDYLKKWAPTFQAKIDEKYKDKYVIFRTLLEEVK
ncbi:MAG: DUF4286 family protein [Cytophagales bacterium]|nr:DUF4286 family protein [Cytophagales bacterium]MDW8384951.1 DUF4286 family protein [Flammeovirgaceae bacterium]